MAISNFYKLLKKKILINAIYLVSCYRNYTKTGLNSSYFFASVSICYCGHFFSILTFDSSHRLSGASGQSFLNSRFYRICRVKANGALKPEYLLKCCKREKYVYVAKNCDTGLKRKPYQSNPVIWIYRFLNLQRQDVGLLFWTTQGSPSRASPLFCLKDISLLVALETVR